MTVIDTLPTGLTAMGLSGSGWTCNVGTVTCTQTTVLTTGLNYAAIVLTVTVASDALDTVTNTVTVAGGGELNTANNTANDVTPIAQVADLTVTKTHTGDFRQGGTGVYTITVNNAGSGSTTGTVRVTDTLPAGLTATGLSGSGWTCSVGTLTCTQTTPLTGGQAYPAIALTVTVANNALAVVTNTATVGGGGEFNTANNTARNATTIIQAADLTMGGGVIPRPMHGRLQTRRLGRLYAHGRQRGDRFNARHKSP